jgi:hypothetical protein
MCLSAPKIPTPQAPQEVKQPDTAAMVDTARRNRAGGMAGGSLLTGPSGIANAAAPTGRTTLLGG